MKILSLGLVVTAIAATPGFAQTFEAASVKANKVGIDNQKEGSAKESIAFDPVSLTLRNVPLKTCLVWAYGVRGYQIAAPSWMEMDRWDIQARTSGPTELAQMRIMLQNLLTARFGLVLHREQKELPVYELLEAKGGAKLKASPAGSGDERNLRIGDGNLIYERFSMGDLAETLPSIPFRVDKMVVDKTGLTGRYDFRLKLAANAVEMKMNFEHSDGSLAFDTVQQIGLRLQARKDMIEMLVIDHANRTPTDN